MVRPRKPEYAIPLEAVPHSSIERKLISTSPAWTMGPEDELALAEALAPPGHEYPMIYEPKKGDDNPNAYRDWLIKILGVLVDCYPPPVNMALDCLRTSLIEVNRGLTPNLFKPFKPARGGKSSFAAQQAMNLAVLAANYIHDAVGNDDSYEQTLADARTTRLEIDQWRNDRIAPEYRCSAIVAWDDLTSANRVLVDAIADYRKYSKGKPRAKKTGAPKVNPASKAVS